MSGFLESSHESQQRRVQLSSEAEELRRNLDTQRRKIRQIHEELESAEIFREELEGRLKSVEMREKPAIMSLAQKLEDSLEGLEEDFFSLVENHVRIISLLREKEKKLHQMSRSQLLGFVKTLLNARDCCLERDLMEEVNTIQVGKYNQCLTA